MKFSWDKFLSNATKIFIHPEVTDIHTIGQFSFFGNKPGSTKQRNLLVFEKEKRHFENLVLGWERILPLDTKLEKDSFPFPSKEYESIELSREKIKWLPDRIRF